MAAALPLEILLTIDPSAPLLRAPADSGLPQIAARSLVYLPLMIGR
jgi:hypothetical protein